MCDVNQNLTACINLVGIHMFTIRSITYFGYISKVISLSRQTERLSQRQPLQLLFWRYVERETGERNDRHANDGGVLLCEDFVRNRRWPTAERLPIQ